MRVERTIDVTSSQIGLWPAEEELAHLFTLSHDLACVIGIDGRFSLVNPAWEARLGWAPEELLARAFLDFVHPDDRAATAAEVCRTLGGDARTHFENRFRGKDGADRRLQWNAVFSPKRQAVCASAHDVTGEMRLEHALIEAGDREKERIGRELHDGLCQNLAGIAALSATLARKLAARGDPAVAAAADLTALLQQAVGDARDLARCLNSAGLAHMGLPVALEALAANIEALHPVACGFACNRKFPRLDSSVETHLYRIGQEAVNNAVAHAKASRIDIRLCVRAGNGSLSIRDNGVGIAKRPVDGAGIGQQTMEVRAAMIGARLRAQRASPRGTLVACVFPLPIQPAKERRHGGQIA